MRPVKGIDSKGYRLYELTEQDLNYLINHEYQVGNILVFSTSEKPRIGKEIGRANTLQAAKSFLADLEQLDLSFPLWVPKDVECVRCASDGLGDSLGIGLGDSLGIGLGDSRIDVRTEGLGNWAGDGPGESPIDSLVGSPSGWIARPSDSPALQAWAAQLVRENEALRTELAEKTQRVEELSFRSLQDDLRHQELMQSLTGNNSEAVLKAVAELDELRVEALTLRKGLGIAEGRCAELDDANVLLTAERTTLLCELDAVQKALDSGNRHQSPDADNWHPLANNQHPNLGWQSRDGEQELVLTNPNGDVIHIYHEFPEIPRSSLRRKLFSRTRQLLFILTGMAVVAYIFYLNSVLDTMKASGIDVALYSKAVMDALLKPFGF